MLLLINHIRYIMAISFQFVDDSCNIRIIQEPCLDVTRIISLKMFMKRWIIFVRNYLRQILIRANQPLRSKKYLRIVKWLDMQDTRELP